MCNVLLCRLLQCWLLLDLSTTKWMLFDIPITCQPCKCVVFSMTWPSSAALQTSCSERLSILFPSYLELHLLVQSLSVACLAISAHSVCSLLTITLHLTPLGLCSLMSVTLLGCCTKSCSPQQWSSFLGTCFFVCGLCTFVTQAGCQAR